eukprot:5774513-Karenia_brevis.AAC.1
MFFDPVIKTFDPNIIFSDAIIKIFIPSTMFLDPLKNFDPNIIFSEPPPIKIFDPIRDDF